MKEYHQPIMAMAALLEREHKGRRVAKSVLTVLICEDNVDSADTLALVVQGAGFEVIKTYSGLQAIAAAKKSKPKVALLDIGLPDLSGYEVAKAIRARASPQQTVLIAITGYGLDEYKKIADQAGFNYYFTKPIDPAFLIRLLEAIRGTTDAEG